MNARDNMHRTGSCTDGGFAKASARFGVVTAQGGWRKVTWGVVAGVAAVATAGSLMVPSAAMSRFSSPMRRAALGMLSSSTRIAWASEWESS